MHAFRTVQFTPEIHIIFAVYLFDLDKSRKRFLQRMKLKK